MLVDSPGPGGAAGPASAKEAVAMAVAGLSWLARADLAAVPVPVQAEALRELERVLSLHTAARAKVLAGFCAQRGFEDDGQESLYFSCHSGLDPESSVSELDSRRSLLRT